MTTNNIDITKGGKLSGLLNVIERKNFDILYTIEGKTGLATTLSILLNEKTGEMITFNYQELKKIIEGQNV